RRSKSRDRILPRVRPADRGGCALLSLLRPITGGPGGWLHGRDFNPFHAGRRWTRTPAAPAISPPPPARRVHAHRHHCRLPDGGDRVRTRVLPGLQLAGDELSAGIHRLASVPHSP